MSVVEVSGQFHWHMPNDGRRSELNGRHTWPAPQRHMHHVQYTFHSKTQNDDGFNAFKHEKKYNL